ncbi:MAG: glycosyltransferase [Alphaproteobacteria bacterium]|nr:glycosyltransferase [Alphaproteobacteria bacterium]
MIDRLRIAHIITSLEPHGAQRVLQQVVTRLPADSFASTCISLRTIDPRQSLAMPVDVPAIGLGMSPGRPPYQAAKLVSLLRRIRPDIIQTWLYHADLAGFFASFFVPSAALVWNIRCSDMEPWRPEQRPSLLLRGLRMSSHRPDAVVVNSRAGMTHHKKMGYKVRNWSLIPNGFDTQRFVPNTALRKTGRLRLGIDPQEVVLGIAARFHIMKGHETLFRALSMLPSPPRLVLFGSGPEAEIERLKSSARQFGVAERLIWAGHWNDIECAYNAIDWLVSASSFGEGFPNVVAEAMSCGTPCLVTNVGDSIDIVGTTGLTVSSGSADQMADAIHKIVALSASERTAMGAAARNRVEREYSIPGMVARYADLYRSLRPTAPA